MFVTVQFLFAIWPSRQIVSTIINISNISQSGGILQEGASSLCQSSLCLQHFYQYLTSYVALPSKLFLWSLHHAIFHVSYELYSCYHTSQLNFVVYDKRE